MKNRICMSCGENPAIDRFWTKDKQKRYLCKDCEDIFNLVSCTYSSRWKRVRYRVMKIVLAILTIVAMILTRMWYYST